MQLVINTYGSYLRKSGNCFLVKKDEKSFEAAVSKISSILITTAAYITTDAIKLAVDNNIDIVFLDAHGDPYGRVWHPKLGSTNLIQRRQLEIYETSEGKNTIYGTVVLRGQVPRKQGLEQTRRTGQGVNDVRYKMISGKDQATENHSSRLTPASSYIVCSYAASEDSDSR